MQLRQYQFDVLKKARDCYNKGYNSPIIVLPCGAGKTIILAEMAKLANKKNNRVLILAHRIEIIEQIKNTIEWWGCDLKLIDVMMVQSATNKLDELPKYDFIITDECHHSVCSTYTKIYNKYPNAFRLGLTATPCRLSGKGLGDVNDIIVEGVSAKWLIENKYLSKYEYYAPKCLIDTSELSITQGDFDNKQASEKLSKPKIYGDVLNEWLKFANGKKTIVYASSIEHSKSVRDYFIKNGISASHLDGKTKKDERHKIMEQFRNGEITVLCNYEIISEGVDVADCECCLLLRPTQSLTLFIQSSMRCMRPSPNKTAVILDFVGNFERHGLPDDIRKWSLNDEPRKKRVTDTEPEISARQCNNCFKVYAGISAVCPYCGFNNGKTKKQIAIDEKAELERIEEVKIKKRKAEERQAVTLQELIELGERRGYKNPAWWARNKYKNSWRNR